MKWQPQRNSPASLYKQGTIDSMVSILKKGSIAFDSGDNTVSNCFEIVDVDGFKNFSLKHFSKAEQLDNLKKQFRKVDSEQLKKNKAKEEEQELPSLF